MKAIEGSASHGDTLLERTEGKVASDPGSAGALIQFNFNINQGAQAARQVGEVVQGVLASVQGVQGELLPGAQLPAGVNHMPPHDDPL